ncbi:uncharacterized protein MELLADRAFT_95042 [Melampsora larici-populina 98AG31]|uniref:Uncharacterized protein n=1 Tax=Melampsora larici-populina (strain 98AG31 / pathotype 3-4-7) TaxID=747676 RepID=F4S8W6_MELLP|nr:uncharacterized protein MELLADRAFT_95042 [Melampsora larici-populina 98AG31]EGF98879.1 hypothetical protein MELLADRAFT_95042 [Melampsora larici-populina 98AG31]
MTSFGSFQCVDAQHAQPRRICKHQLFFLQFRNWPTLIQWHDYILWPIKAKLESLLQETTKKLAAQTQVIAQMQSQANSREQAYDTLLKKFEDVAIKPPPKSKSKTKLKDQPAAGSSMPQPPSATTSRMTPTPKRRSSTATPKKATIPRKSTPKSSPAVKSARRASGPPPKASPKRSPYELEMKTLPAGFTSTKSFGTWRRPVQYLWPPIQRF